MMKARFVVPLSILLFAACSQPKSTRWNEKAEAAKKGETPKVDKSTVAKGGSLNAFFPAEAGGLKRTFTQEKTGFAEAELVSEGKKVKASISDTNNNPPARKKYEKASDTVAGHPLVTVGSKQSAVLVAGRWQVKVSSSELGPDARKALLEKFNLSGLAGMK